MTALELDPAFVLAGWRDDAACRTAPTYLFFPQRGDVWSVALAKQICARCAVRADCLDYALAAHETVGIWGGTSEQERRRLRWEQRRLS